MSYSDKNWRGLDRHPIDEWDSWMIRSDEYQQTKEKWEALGMSEIDTEKLKFFSELVSRFEACEQAERDAGADI